MDGQEGGRGGGGRRNEVRVGHGCVQTTRYTDGTYTTINPEAVSSGCRVDLIALLRVLASVGEQLINDALKLFEVIALAREMAVPFHEQHFGVAGTPQSNRFWVQPD